MHLWLRDRTDPHACPSYHPVKVNGP